MLDLSTSKWRMGGGGGGGKILPRHLMRMRISFPGRESPQSIMDRKVLDKVCIGLRVVRGPDWEWGDQDGGEGHVGTVVELDVARRAAVVQWDCTERCLYRCGHDSKYDLRVFDSGPTGA